jgi:hypothetical protein
MSDEAFLSRWSRRKRAAGEAAPGLAPATPVPAPNAREPEGEQAANQGSETARRDAKDPRETPPSAEVDVSALPPVDSITAETDIRAFLASGVPAQLARAALRRAWSADPAIRDFVGLAENAWDFTAPDGVPGFGPLLPGDEGSRLVVDAARPLEEGKTGISATLDESEGKPLREEERTASSTAGDVEESQLAAAAHTPDDEHDDAAAAVQKKAAVEERPVRVSRGHGGALPR